jgi:hypothetical protein
MREIRGSAKTVRELLDDLADKFRDDYDEEEQDRSAVAEYGHYFLGSIIVSQKQNQSFIIDGQQRLTTLTLLLIFLNNLQRGREHRVQLQDLIFSEKYGRRSFNLDVDERTPAMDALFNETPFDDTGRPESLRNIVARYRDIEEHLDQDLRGDALPFFIDWLVENVHLVAITAYSDDDA